MFKEGDSMNIEDILKKAPSPFEPQKLPIDLSKIYSNQKLVNLMMEANNLLGMYNGLLLNTPNPMLLISPLIAQEASLSSKLEGTHATLSDILDYDAGVKVSIEEDEMEEVTNYRKALFYSLEKMSIINNNKEDDKIPLSSRLIKEIHKILMDNVRGANKSPGEFKKMQNYIGGYGSISFTPVSPSLTNEYMYNLEEYIHDEDLNPVIQSALIHAQFEIIHPFQDGNGRIGRLLIPLFLYYRRKLVLPTFYMSSYFEKDKSLYIQKLSNISKYNDYEGWIEYFMLGIIDQANENSLKAKYLLDAYAEIKEISLENIKSQYIIPLIDFIFQHPKFSIKQSLQYVDASRETISSLVKQLEELGVLLSDGALRNRIYYAEKILDELE